MMSHPQTLTRKKVGAAALLAAGVLFTSVAPSSAGVWPPRHDFSGGAAHASSFSHHFWRGTQHRRVQVPRADMMAVADETDPMDEAMTDCAGRFRSYDPATGTYLGYDGNEHPCP